VQILLIQLVLEPAIDSQILVGFHAHRGVLLSSLMIQERGKARYRRRLNQQQVKQAVAAILNGVEYLLAIIAAT
jgi:hypothetical protein